MGISFYTGAENYARSSDFDSLVDGIYGNGVHNGMAVTANGTGLGVNVAAGSYTANRTKVQYAGATPAVTLSAADGSNARYDIITADSSGTIAIVAGTPAAAPDYPDIPAGKIRLAIIKVTAGLVTLLSGNVYDALVAVNISKGSGVISSGAASVTVSDRAIKTASKIILTMRTNPVWTYSHTHTMNVPNGTPSDSVGIFGSVLAGAMEGADVTISGNVNSASISGQYFWADTITDAISFVIHTDQNVGTDTTMDYLIIG